jgi:prophage tail gpP-like protein
LTTTITTTIATTIATTSTITIAKTITTDLAPEVASEPKAHLSFILRNSETLQDSITALTEQGIEFWLNQDGSVGFYGANNGAVDTIGFNAMGAYTARN